ncbi:MAG: biotin/lipoyl-containing protein [Bdellovibrionota bacterium]
MQSQADMHTVNVNGAAIEIKHTDPYALQNMSAGAGAQGDIKAVMPGRVVKILVQEGQDVTQGQPVLVLEAMKMENEIKAPVAGKIEKICVAESASVESGAMLVNIEPI